MKKHKIIRFKKCIDRTLFTIYVFIILFNVMLIVELNECWLFYSISLNVILIMRNILTKYSRLYQTFIINGVE